MNPMSQLLGQLKGSLDKQMNSDNIYYIYVPHMQLFLYALRTTFIMFILYLLSANSLITSLLIPAYFIVLYIYYVFWLNIKRYNFRLFPFIISLILLNIPFYLIAFYVRALILNLF